MGAFPIWPPGQEDPEPEHHPRLWRMVGQAGIEPTLSGLRRRKGDHTPLSHGAGLSRLSPLVWQSFAVSFSTSTLALAGVAGRCKAVHGLGALSDPCCTSLVAGFRPPRQLFPLAEAVLGFLANLPKTERSDVLRGTKSRTTVPSGSRIPVGQPPGLSRVSRTENFHGRIPVKPPGQDHRFVA